MNPAISQNSDITVSRSLHGESDSSKYFQNTLNSLSLIIQTHGYCRLNTNWGSKVYFSSPFNRLYIVKNGRGVLEFAGRQIKLEKNKAYLVPLNIKFRYWCADYLEKFYIHFLLKTHSSYDVFELYKPVAFDLPTDRMLNRLVETFSDNDEKGIVRFKNHLLTQIAAFIGEKTDDYDKKIRAGAKYNKLFEYVENNLSARLSVKDLAGLMNYTPQYLSMIFKADMGESLKSHLMEKIFRKAQELLINTDKHIKEVAFLLGFQDQYYFSKFFSRKSGLTPKEYRKNKML